MSALKSSTPWWLQQGLPEIVCLNLTGTTVYPCVLFLQGHVNFKPYHHQFIRMDYFDVPQKTTCWLELVTRKVTTPIPRVLPLPPLPWFSKVQMGHRQEVKHTRILGTVSLLNVLGVRVPGACWAVSLVPPVAKKKAQSSIGLSGIQRLQVKHLCFSKHWLIIPRGRRWPDEALQQAESVVRTALLCDPLRKPTGSKRSIATDVSHSQDYHTSCFSREAWVPPFSQTTVLLFSLKYVLVWMMNDWQGYAINRALCRQK